MIPQNIHHIVLGQKTNPIVEHCLASWQILQKAGFRIRVWNDEQIMKFLARAYPHMSDAYCNSRNLAEAADIARYLIIYHYGGHYMDWDVQLLSPVKYLDLCNKNPRGYLIVDPANETIAGEAFSARSKEPFLMSLSRDIMELYDSKQRDLLSTPQYSGPYRVRDSLKMHANASQTIVGVKDVFVYNYAEIRDMPEREIRQPLVHYWIHSWIDVDIEYKRE